MWGITQDEAALCAPDAALCFKKLGLCHVAVSADPSSSE